MGFRVPWMMYKYILSEITRPFLGAAFFFTFVLMMFQVIRLSDFFIKQGVSGYSILVLMWYLLLTFTPVIFPIAFLLAVLLGFGRLSGDGEVIAMRSFGASAPIKALEDRFGFTPEKVLEAARRQLARGRPAA